MLCESCKQNQATVHLTEIVNDEMSELHLCEACANQKGTQVESHFGLTDLLSGLTDVEKSPEKGEVSTKACPNCGMTFEDFRRVGRLGCSECYAAFRNSLGSLLKRIHGSTIHLGKGPVKAGKPGKGSGKSELAELKRRLERAILFEEFEEAAQLRDQVRQAEQRKRQKTIARQPSRNRPRYWIDPRSMRMRS